MNLVEFQINIINGNDQSAKDMLLELDRKTEKDSFQKAANYFGFKLFDADGVLYASRTQLAPIFGMQDESGIRKICERKGVLTRSLGWFGQSDRTRARETFDLQQTDNKSTFVDYQGFLTIGAMGTTEATRQVFAYLLQMEQVGRLAIGAKDLMKHEDRKYAHTDKVIGMMCKIDKMNNGALKQKAAERLDELLDGALELGKQASLFGGGE